MKMNLQQNEIDIATRLIPLLSTAVGTLIGVLAFLLTRKQAVKQGKIEESKFIVDAAKNLLEPYVARVEHLEMCQEKSEKIIAENKRTIANLTDQVVKLTASIDEKTNTVIALTRQINNKDKRIAELEETVKVLQGKVASLESKADKANGVVLPETQIEPENPKPRKPRRKVG